MADKIGQITPDGTVLNSLEVPNSSWVGSRGTFELRPAYTGAVYAFTLRINNAGPHRAGDVRLTVDLPPELTPTAVYVNGEAADALHWDGEVQVRLAGTCAECSAKAAERGLKRAA